jgi:hypothetical protein
VFLDEDVAELGRYGFERHADPRSRRASRWWLRFGRIVVVLLRTDDAEYEGRPDLGATRAQWNGREWMTADRSGVTSWVTDSAYSSSR